MPADAIHLAALCDLRDSGRWPSAAAPPWEAARLGAVFVDLPYYERIGLTLAAHVLGRHVSWSDWGHRFHTERPVAFASALLAEARGLRSAAATRAAGDWLAAFTLGAVCHAAVDRALHPLINRLASTRAAGRPLSREHQEVEKLQSILFHRERFGRELLGKPELVPYMTVDATPLVREPVLEGALFRASAQTYGTPLEAQAVDRWTRGYQAYVRLMAGALGPHVVSEGVLEEARPGVYQGPSFERRFQEAVAFAARCVDAAARELEEGGRSAGLDATLPEGTLDPLDEVAA